ncbi:MAG TPA: replication protein [Syntrophomonadaceae bacterium]|nr:replication protein [Syntrophomonadaceae bacterium]HPR92829.1 replication protein [Syntrophomonadaceae bacterium]
MSNQNSDKPVARVEKGFTRIPNVFLDALICSNLSSMQKDMCYYLIRRSFGWGKDSADVSLNDFAFVCGTSKSYISKQQKELLAKNVVIRLGRKPGSKTVYSLNPDIAQWDNSCIDLDFYQDFIRTGRTNGLHSSITPGLHSGITSGLHSSTTPGLHSSTTSDTASGLEGRASEAGLKKVLNKYKENISSCEDLLNIQLSQLLLNKILEHLPGFKKPDLFKWAETMEKIIRIDERDPDELKQVILFSQNDSFWRTNILSAEKLRKQYDVLNAKRLAKYSGSKIYSRKEGDKDEYDFFFDR